jgi:hypothetical protein
MDYMSANSVVLAKTAPFSELAAPFGPETVLADRDELRIAVATALAQGYSAKQVARAFGKRLVPESPAETPDKIHLAAYQKVRKWMNQDQSFRDLMWDMALNKLDLKAPLILNGIANKAMRGRVDAARLALELTGRHTPKGDQVLTNVTIQIANIPRPE